MAQSKKANNEIRAMLLQSGAVAPSLDNNSSSGANSFKTTDRSISHHNAIMARRRELNKLPVPATPIVTNKS